jgi:hypothetical protein
MPQSATTWRRYAAGGPLTEGKQQGRVKLCRPWQKNSIPMLLGRHAEPVVREVEASLPNNEAVEMLRQAQHDVQVDLKDFSDTA